MDPAALRRYRRGYPVQYRAGMLMAAAAQRNRQMGKIAAHPPAPFEHVARRLGGVGVLIAEGDAVMHENTWCLAPTPQPRGVPPNNDQAVSDSRSVSRIAAAEQEQQQSPAGRSAIAHSSADGATASVSPLSRTIASVDKVSRPAGATIRLQILPKLSRYSPIGIGGSATIGSGLTRSDAREGCTRKVSTIAVGCGDSYVT